MAEGVGHSKTNSAFFMQQDSRSNGCTSRKAQNMAPISANKLTQCKHKSALSGQST